MAWTNPLAGRVTSGFSLARRHPVTGRVAPHRGTDIAPRAGYTLVGAIEDGVVVGVRTGSYRGDSRWNTHLAPGGIWYATGNAVVIEHAGGVYSYYGHLASALVGRGQAVRAGQTIGRAGTTGMSTGVHLHLEIVVGRTHVNPYTFMQARGVTLGTGRTSISTGPTIPSTAFPSVQMLETPIVFTLRTEVPRF